MTKEENEALYQKLKESRERDPKRFFSLVLEVKREGIATKKAVTFELKTANEYAKRHGLSL